MNPATLILSLIASAPTLINDIGKIQNAIALATSNEDLTTKLQGIGKTTFAVLTDLGGSLFPQVQPVLHAAAAAMTIFDTADSKKWLQGALNLYVAPTPPLAVDGIIGPKTLAAMAIAQDKLSKQFNIPLKTDSWAGMLTQGLLQTAVAQLKG